MSENREETYPAAPGYKYTYATTDIALATSIIHESIHAFIMNQRGNGVEGFKGNMRDDPQDHEMIATKFRNEIVSTITEYNDNKKLGYSKEDIQTLSWLGLQNTKAFSSQFKTEKEQKDWKTAIDKLLVKVSVEK